jgi:hypothetical protein
MLIRVSREGGSECTIKGHVCDVRGDCVTYQVIVSGPKVLVFFACSMLPTVHGGGVYDTMLAGMGHHRGLFLELDDVKYASR